MFLNLWVQNLQLVFIIQILILKLVFVINSMTISIVLLVFFKNHVETLRISYHKRKIVV